MTPLVPDRCMICGAAYKGGHQLPSLPMQIGLKVIYACGASLSIKDADMGCFILSLKNCCSEDGNGGK